MGFGEALWGGFSSFFSLWQVCILQISPFFLGLILGTYLLAQGRQADPPLTSWILPPFIAYLVGFTLIYSLLIASGFRIGRTLAFNIGNLRLIAGVVILLIGAYIIMADRKALLERFSRPALLSLLFLLIGLTFAVIYSPCITPAMSEIMGLASRPATAGEGFRLALFYGAGLTLALGLTGTVLILVLRKNSFARRHRQRLKDICGAIIIIPGILNITGLMTNYKAFFLGFFVQ